MRFRSTGNPAARFPRRWEESIHVLYVRACHTLDMSQVSIDIRITAARADKKRHEICATTLL